MRPPSRPRGLLARVLLPGVITRVETRRPLIALTFDDGPDPESTLPLLEILERHGARGTFFMRGAAAAEHPQLLDRVVQGGHSVGNHTWSHPVLPRIPSRDRIRELRACRRALGAHAGRLFRPPYLAQSRRSRLEALTLGLQVIMCNVDSGDWWRTEADEIVGKLLEDPRGGDIVLLHDALFLPDGGALAHAHVPFPGRGPMLEAMERYLGEMAGRFRHVTVPELLRAGRPERHPWYQAGPRVVREVRAG